MPTITSKDGTEIFYKDWGSGQPIVFSHGWPLTGERAGNRTWDLLLESTAAHHIVERFFTHWLLQPNFARLFKNEVIDHPSVPILLNGTVARETNLKARERAARKWSFVVT